MIIVPIALFTILFPKPEPEIVDIGFYGREMSRSGSTVVGVDLTYGRQPRHMVWSDREGSRPLFKDLNPFGSHVRVSGDGLTVAGEERSSQGRNPATVYLQESGHEPKKLVDNPNEAFALFRINYHGDRVLMFSPPGFLIWDGELHSIPSSFHADGTGGKPGSFLGHFMMPNGQGQVAALLKGTNTLEILGSFENLPQILLVASDIEEQTFAGNARLTSGNGCWPFLYSRVTGFKPLKAWPGFSGEVSSLTDDGHVAFGNLYGSKQGIIPVAWIDGGEPIALTALWSKLGVKIPNMVNLTIESVSGDGRTYLFAKNAVPRIVMRLPEGIKLEGS